jgi:hypothetical protein
MFFVFDFVKAEPVDAAFEIKRKAARADVTKYPAVSTPNRHRRRPMDMYTPERVLAHTLPSI